MSYDVPWRGQAAGRVVCLLWVHVSAAVSRVVVDVEVAKNRMWNYWKLEHCRRARCGTTTMRKAVSHSQVMMTSLFMSIWSGGSVRNVRNVAYASDVYYIVPKVHGCSCNRRGIDIVTVQRTAHMSHNFLCSYL
jgi:hypothetical protein